MTTIPGVGPQLARAAAGTDPRGWLVFEYLPPTYSASRMAAPRPTVTAAASPSPDQPPTPNEPCWSTWGLSCPNNYSSQTSATRAAACGADNGHN